MYKKERRGEVNERIQRCKRSTIVDAFVLFYLLIKQNKIYYIKSLFINLFQLLLVFILFDCSSMTHFCNYISKFKLSSKNKLF